jgi:hypothetical protein
VKFEITRQSWPSIEAGHMVRDQRFTDSQNGKARGRSSGNS